MERFFGVLIEHYAGSFPVWLSPVQAVFIPITDSHVPYCEQVAKRLTEAGVRVEVWAGKDRMNNKIRLAQKQKIPYSLIVGDNEQEGGQVAVRRRGGENLGAISVDEFEALALQEIADKV